MSTKISIQGYQYLGRGLIKFKIGEVRWNSAGRTTMS